MKFLMCIFLLLFSTFTSAAMISQSEFEELVKQYFEENKPLFDKVYGYQNIKLVFKSNSIGGSADLIDKRLNMGKNKEAFFKPWYSYKEYIPNASYLYLADKDLSIQNNLKNYIPIAKKSNDYLFQHDFLNTIEDEKMLIDFVVMHELGHLYFKNRNKYPFHYMISHIYKDEFQSNFLRDEFYADLAAFKIMKQKRGTDFIEKIKHFRITSGFFYALQIDQPYIHYFFKDVDLNNLPQDIKGYVDDIFIKTMKMFVPKKLIVNSEKETIIKIRKRYDYCVSLNEQEKIECFNAYSIDPNESYKINRASFSDEVEEVLTHFK